MRDERFYHIVCLLGKWPLVFAWKPRVLHRERGAAPGAFILASNHSSPADSPLLMLATKRPIHWLSIVELFQNPLLGWFLCHMGALPLDRSRPDPRTTRAVIRKLRDGCVVGVFPEGRWRRGEDSVLRGGELNPGVCELAALAGVPVVPCAITGAEQFSRVGGWLPLRRTRIGVAYGEPIPPPPKRGRAKAVAAMNERLGEQIRALHRELEAAS